MKPENFAELALDNSDFICYIVDYATYEILYMTNATKRAFLGSVEKDFAGKKCYNFFNEIDKPCHFCNVTPEANRKKIRREVLNIVNKRYYTVAENLIELNGKAARLIFGYDSSSQNEQVSSLVTELFFEETLIKCINTLRGERDVSESIKELLSIVGEFYESDRAYIFEFDPKKNVANNTYEWSIDESYASKESDKCIGLPELIPIFENFEVKGEFLLSDIYSEISPTSRLYDFLERTKSYSALAVPFVNKQPLTSFMGVTNPKKNTKDLSLLHSVVIFVADDIRKRKMYSELEHLSYVDSITGLNNRNKYVKFLKKLESHKFDSLGIVHLTMNGLKKINELYGEQYGDKILKQVANIFQMHIKGDLFRPSGDEFIGIWQNVSRQYFENSISNLKERSLKSKDFSFSVGTTWQDKNINLRQGLLQASELMLVEKQEYYNKGFGSKVLARTNAIEILLEEIRNKEFFVYLQPKVLLVSGKIVEAEALVRKKSSDGQVNLPIKFVPIYENESTIGHLDFFVIEEVCVLLQQLIKDSRPLKISINFSTITILHYDLLGELTRVCARYNVQHKYIKIEINESVESFDNQIYEAKLKDLREAGFDITLDNFGIKDSRLLMLISSELSEVKIDKSLTGKITHKSQGRIVVKNIIRTIKELGISKCVAEGIETFEQQELLKNFGCVYGQGYFFYHPMPIGDFMRAYEENLRSAVFIPKEANEAEGSNTIYEQVTSGIAMSIIETMPICMSLWSSSLELLSCNQNMLDLFDIPSMEEFKKNYNSLFAEKQPDGRYSEIAGLGYMDEAMRNGSVKFNWLHQKLNGEEIPAEITLYKLGIQDEKSDDLIVAYVRDLRPHLADNLEEEEINDYFFNEISDKKLFKTIAELSAEWFWVYNNKTAKIQFFGKGREILNLSAEKMPFPEYVVDTNMVYKDDLETFLEFNEALKNGIMKPTEVRFILPNGKVRHFNIVYKVIYDHENEPIFSIGKTYDIEEQTALKLVSQKDLLTNSYNKITTENIIIDIIDRDELLSHVMFVIDLDDFKEVNNKHGHHFGDLVLAEIGNNLHACFREADIIGRIRDDEFIIFVQNLQDRKTITAKAKAIIDSFSQSRFKDSEGKYVTGSIGIAIYPDDGFSFEEIYKNADKALLKSKRNGKNCFTFYEED